MEQCNSEITSRSNISTSPKKNVSIMSPDKPDLKSFVLKKNISKLMSKSLSVRLKKKDEKESAMQKIGRKRLQNLNFDLYRLSSYTPVDFFSHERQPNPFHSDHIVLHKDPTDNDRRFLKVYNEFRKVSLRKDQLIVQSLKLIQQYFANLMWDQQRAYSDYFNNDLMKLKFEGSDSDGPVNFHNDFLDSLFRSNLSNDNLSYRIKNNFNLFNKQGGKPIRRNSHQLISFEPSIVNEFIAQSEMEYIPQSHDYSIEYINLALSFFNNNIQTIGLEYDAHVDKLFLLGNRQIELCRNIESKLDDKKLWQSKVETYMVFEGTWIFELEYIKGFIKLHDIKMNQGLMDLEFKFEDSRVISEIELSQNSVNYDKNDNDMVIHLKLNNVSMKTLEQIKSLQFIQQKNTDFNIEDFKFQYYPNHKYKSLQIEQHRHKLCFNKKSSPENSSVDIEGSFIYYDSKNEVNIKLNIENITPMPASVSPIQGKPNSSLKPKFMLTFIIASIKIPFSFKNISIDIRRSIIKPDYEKYKNIIMKSSFSLDIIQKNNPFNVSLKKNVDSNLTNEEKKKKNKKSQLLDPENITTDCIQRRSAVLEKKRDSSSSMSKFLLKNILKDRMKKYISFITTRNKIRNSIKIQLTIAKQNLLKISPNSTLIQEIFTNKEVNIQYKQMVKLYADANKFLKKQSKQVLTNYEKRTWRTNHPQNQFICKQKQFHNVSTEIDQQQQYMFENKDFLSDEKKYKEFKELTRNKIQDLFFLQQFSPMIKIDNSQPKKIAMDVDMDSIRVQECILGVKKNVSQNRHQECTFNRPDLKFVKSKLLSPRGKQEKEDLFSIGSSFKPNLTKSSLSFGGKSESLIRKLWSQSYLENNNQNNSESGLKSDRQNKNNENIKIINTNTNLIEKDLEKERIFNEQKVVNLDVNNKRQRARSSYSTSRTKKNQNDQDNYKEIENEVRRINLENNKTFSRPGNSIKNIKYKIRVKNGENLSQQKLRDEQKDNNLNQNSDINEKVNKMINKNRPKSQGMEINTKQLRGNDLTNLHSYSQIWHNQMKDKNEQFY